MGATKQDIDDFDFIFEEMIRLKKLLNQSYDLYLSDFDSELHSMCATINIPRDIYENDKKQKTFQLLLSSKAQYRLMEITERQIKQNHLSYELTISEYIEDIKDSIYIHVMKNKKFDSSGYSSLLSTAYKRAKYKMKEIKYFFPFHAEDITPNKDIHIGSVKIIHKDKIYPKIKDDKRFNIFIGKDKESNYNSFLCIDIPKCSNNISEQRAYNVADFIYGVIKVFATHFQVHTEQMVLRKNPSLSNINHYITSIDNKYFVNGSFKTKENLDKFWNVLEEDLKSDLGIIINQLIEYAISPKKENCLSDRLIDSFYWFGDASRDNNKHSQVVKLVTAMERLVTLSIEKKDAKLTERFSNRVSCSIAIFNGEIDKWEKEAKQIYKLRSDLVHGTQTLYKSYNIPLKFSSFELTSKLILSSCISFSQLGLELTKYEYKLQNMYEKLVEHCKKDEYIEKK